MVEVIKHFVSYSFMVVDFINFAYKLRWHPQNVGIQKVWSQSLAIFLNLSPLTAQLLTKLSLVYKIYQFTLSRLQNRLVVELYVSQKSRFDPSTLFQIPIHNSSPLQHDGNTCQCDRLVFARVASGHIRNKIS